MKIYHGSDVSGIEVLRPQKSAHEKEYIYFSTDIVVASLYTVHPLPRPYHYFPYGFDNGREGRCRYAEYYPYALKEVYGGKRGFIYECDVDEEKLENPTQIFCARVSSVPVKVDKCIKIEDMYKWLLQREGEGKFVLKRFETLTENGLQNWYKRTAEDMVNDGITPATDNPYIRFIKDKMPKAWELFEQQIRESAK